MKRNLFFSPAAAESNGAAPAAAAPSQPPGAMDAETMDAVFAELANDLPAELLGKFKTGAAKPAQPAAVAAAAADPNAIKDELPPGAEVITDGAEPDPNAEPAADPNAEPAEPAAPEFTPEQQTWIDTQKAALDTELATARQQAEALAGERDQLRTQLTAQPKAIAEVDPILLIDDPAQLAGEAAKWKHLKSWAREHWDGVEAGADGKGGHTPETVRAAYAKAEAMLDEVLPAAKQSILTRQQWDAETFRQHPDMAKPNHPDAQIAEGILAVAPGLKAVFPNWRMVIADAIVGERVRLAKNKAAAAAKAKPAAAAKPAVPGTTTPAAPKVPTRVAAGKAPVAAKAAAKPAGLSVKRFHQMGGDESALAAMLLESGYVN